MRLGFWQSILIIGMCVLGTIIPRFLAFVVFPADKPTPQKIVYLGKVLPYAITAMLIVYCLKDVTPFTTPYALPELIALLAVVFIYLAFKNSLAAIAAGTVVYMLLLQIVFV